MCTLSEMAGSRDGRIGFVSFTSPPGGSALLGVPGYREEMGAHAHQARFLLNSSGCPQDAVATRWLLPPVPHHPARALDAEQTLELQSGLLNLRPQLLRVVEERRRELSRAARGVSVLTLGKIAVHDRVESRIAEPAADQAVQERREP
jgi:hypothetical protein